MLSIVPFKTNKYCFMKKLFLSFFFVFVLFSCESSSSLDWSLTSSRIIVIDSCEYVVYKSGYGLGLCHKGNCSNFIHYGN